MGIFDKAISKYQDAKSSVRSINRFIIASGLVFTFLSGCAPAHIDYFKYLPANPLAGDTITILWRVEHATSVTLASSTSNSLWPIRSQVNDSGSLIVATDARRSEEKFYEIEAKGIGAQVNAKINIKLESRSDMQKMVADSLNIQGFKKWIDSLPDPARYEIEITLNGQRLKLIPDNANNCWMNEYNYNEKYIHRDGQWFRLN